jgi:hypothetical protein
MNEINQTKDAFPKSKAIISFVTFRSIPFITG